MICQDTAFGTYPFAGHDEPRLVHSISIETAWKLANGGANSTAWNIFTKQEKDTSAKILKDASKDLSWLIKTKKEKESAYRIYNQTIKGSSWNIFLVDSKDIAWSLRSGKNIDSSYRIFTIDTNDTAWSVGFDQAILGTAVFKFIKADPAFSGRLVKVAFSGKEKTIIFY